MKNTGIIRRIDDLGRIIVPKEIRRTLNLREGDPLEIFVADGMVCFKKYYAENGYREMINDIIANLNEDYCVENSAEIKSKLNEVLELFKGKEGKDGE